MKHNAKENLRKALDELSSCQNHLNTAYLNSEEKNNRAEIHTALKSVTSAVDLAKTTLNHYKD